MMQILNSSAVMSAELTRGGILPEEKNKIANKNRQQSYLTPSPCHNDKPRIESVNNHPGHESYDSSKCIHWQANTNFTRNSPS
jgi:hypothetical protein